MTVCFELHNVISCHLSCLSHPLGSDPSRIPSSGGLPVEIKTGYFTSLAPCEISNFKQYLSCLDTI